MTDTFTEHMNTSVSGTIPPHKDISKGKTQLLYSGGLIQDVMFAITNGDLMKRSAMTWENKNKLAVFMKALEEQTTERDTKSYKTLVESAREDGRRTYAEFGLEIGDRFIKIIQYNGQTSVRFFVEISTGNIYGAKGYKAYNNARQYGTLDTIGEWEWGDYEPVSKSGKSSLVPKSERR